MVNTYTKANKMQRVIVRLVAIALILTSKSYVTKCSLCGAERLYVVDGVCAVCVSCSVFTGDHKAGGAA
jgi:hypothetical protein